MEVKIKHTDTEMFVCLVVVDCVVSSARRRRDENSDTKPDTSKDTDKTSGKATTRVSQKVHQRVCSPTEQIDAL